MPASRMRGDLFVCPSGLTPFLSAIAIFAVLAFPATASAQTGSINGVVTTMGGGDALSGVSVRVVGVGRGVLSDGAGRYLLDGLAAGTVTLRVELLGYGAFSAEVVVMARQVTTRDVSLSVDPLGISGIVVSGSRRAEKLTEAPITISIIDAAQLEMISPILPTGALERLPGVSVNRSGVVNWHFNARGFTSAFNYRFQVMADNRKVHLPGTGTAINSGVIPREDVDRIEFLPGPSSALYGPNAHNGLLHVISKHPREYPGTSITVGGGENSMRIVRVRHAEAKGRFAYKANFDYVGANDWIRNDTMGIDANGTVLFQNPIVNTSNLIADASVFMSLWPGAELVASESYNEFTTTDTNNLGRTQVDGGHLQSQSLRLTSPSVFAHVYRTSSGLGDSFTFEGSLAARLAAAQAGSPITEAESRRAVRLIDNSVQWNYEVQYNRSFPVGSAEVTLVGGIQHESLTPNTEGTLLAEGRINFGDPRPGGEALRQTGVYAQLDAQLTKNWRVVLAARHDQHNLYDSQTSPRVGVVYTIPNRGSFRLTFNKAFQAPAVLQQDILLVAGVIPGTPIPIVVRGNGRGFTMSDGTEIAPLSPERNTTYEAGYKGTIGNRLSVDVSAYHSTYQNFISPATPITNPATGLAPVESGGEAIPGWPGEFVLTYANFGRVVVRGVDLSVGVQLSPRVDAWSRYSLVKPKDLEEPENDFNQNGTFEELSFNTPENQATIGFGVRDLFVPGLYGSVQARWVEAYDFVGGNHSETEAGEGEGRFMFVNGGPLGDFTTFDVNLSYRINESLRWNLAATNLFDSKLRQAVGSPDIRRLVITELKYTIR